MCLSTYLPNVCGETLTFYVDSSSVENIIVQLDVRKEEKRAKIFKLTR